MIALASTVIVFTLLTTAGVVNPMALPVVSLMLPAFKDKAVVMPVMPVVVMSPLAIV
jgi:hypothetical protein